MTDVTRPFRPGYHMKGFQPYEDEAWRLRSSALPRVEDVYKVQGAASLCPRTPQRAARSMLRNREHAARSDDGLPSIFSQLQRDKTYHFPPMPPYAASCRLSLLSCLPFVIRDSVTNKGYPGNKAVTIAA